MPQHGFFRRPIRWFAAGWMAVVTFCLVQPCQAQRGPIFIPPAPLGTPMVAVGPAANPFGPPPLAIGPAPGPVPAPAFIVPPYGPVPYPVTPYAVRRPTPFEATEPIGSAQPLAGPSPFAGPAPLGNLQQLSGPGPIPLGAPQPIEARSFLERQSLPTPVANVAPIGNLRLTVGEAFLNRIVARDEQRPGDVRDFILGAEVTGKQITDTKVRLDLLPSADKVRGMLVLNGFTQSMTTGVTPQAAVNIAGQQQFFAHKEIFFDGLKFSTRHAVVSARAHNQTTGAVTPLTGTFIGSIADRIAFRAAEKRKAEGEAIARDRVVERVFPEFDNGIDKQLANANEQLETQVRPLLNRVNLMPSQQQTSSTDTSLMYCLQLGTESPTTSPALLEFPSTYNDGATVQVHESLLNFLVEKAGLKGLKTNDKQMRELMEPYQMKSSNTDPDTTPLSAPGMGDIVTEIEFDDTDPLNIRLEQDKAVVTMRAKFKPGGQDLLPPLVMTIEYKTTIEGNSIVVTPGKVNVVPAKDGDNSVATGIALKLISQAAQANLSKLAVDRSLPARFWTFGGAVPQVTGIRSQNGWTVISVN